MPSARDIPAKVRALRWGGLDVCRGIALRRGKPKKKKMTSSFPGVAREFVRCRFDRLSLASICFPGAAAFAPNTAFAVNDCSPGTGDNVTVTCSGAVLNQGPEANTGYGSGLQNGLTINVVAAPPSSVTGTSIGIDVGSNNIINNFGTVTTAGSGGIGDVFGINANGT